MKNRLAVLCALISCLYSAAFTKSAWAAAPGTRYSDAFVLLQQAQTAEEKADLATAYHKYQAALDILHGIRTDSPDWNGQMVEFRLKDCQARFDAVKAKLPGGPPAAAGTEAPLVVTPAVAVSPEQLASPPLPAATPPPVVKAAPNDQSAKLRAQLDKLLQENEHLKSDLTEARRTAKPNPQVDKLTRENKDLKDQLAAAEKKAADAKAATASESPELKKLRADLDKARAETDAARKSAAQVPELQKQNQDLGAQLEAAKKQASSVVTPVVAAPVADSAEVKKLRADAEKARKTAADLERQNADLSSKLAAEKKTAATASPGESSDARIMKQLRNENSYLRNLLDTYAANNPELRGQLRHHDQNQVKTSQ